LTPWGALDDGRFMLTVETLTDPEGTFDVTVAHGRSDVPGVLFAVGGGGDPTRHAPLLGALAAKGHAVVAPHFTRIGPAVEEAHLLVRARRLTQALDAFVPGARRAVGIGHSIGATTLLALAGAVPWLGPGRPVAIEPLSRLYALALLAPTTGFFRGPGALDGVAGALYVHAGAADTITPPAHGELLRDALAGRARVELRVTEGAGHFSFMHTPPPGTIEPLADRDGFLAALVREVVAFAGA
jgi:fermentation-respiration switch protein FrsA (DUF1100 family)